MIYFVHIPKTAGTTIREILRGIYGDRFANDTLETADDRMPSDAILNDLETHLADIDVYTAHMPFGLHEYLARPYLYMTFVREPVSQNVSHYNFLLRAGGDFAAYFTEHGFDGYFSVNGVAWNNMQTRFLAGRDALFKPELDDHDLQQAQHNLETEVDLLGLVEAFDESIVYFQHVLNWPAPFYLRVNQSSRYNHPKLITKSQLTPAQRALVQARNQYDLALYEFARSLFQARIAQLGDNFQRDVQRFKWQNRLYYLWRVSRNKIRGILEH
ncbi:MAG: sulfotransferase family 2 domain-containing protein [Anaerolineae bacterium]